MRILMILTLATASFAQGPGRGGGGPVGPGLVKPAEGERIAWYGTLTEGLALAKKTNRPILLVSAAPHCHNISGVW